ncbi:MAG: FG-GAP repeat protein [Thermoplasmata archaeon]|nr:FG-GAP repeat protein [Thermoplasmata archaeon]
MGWTNVTDLGNEYISSNGEVKIRFKANTEVGDITNAGSLSIDYLDVRNDTFTATPQNIELPGETAGDLFGWSVANVSNINVDGSYDDVIVGAPGYSSSKGRAYIYYGASSMDSTADLTLTGKSSGDKFGYSVHYAGDIDGDGDPDVIIGAPYNDSSDGSKTDCGAIYVYCGGSDIDSTVNFTNYGEYANDHFGWAVSFAGDINNDNLNEVIVGAPHYNTQASENPPSATDAGKAYVLCIPEFVNIIIPISSTFIILIIFYSWRRRSKR